MRARRAFFIAGGVLVLGVVLLLVRPRPERLMVTVLYETNTAPTSYAVQVANMGRTPCVFSAWSEFRTNGVWDLEKPGKQGSIILKPSETSVFTLPKPPHGKRRIAVLYRRVSSGNWDRWRERLKAWMGIHSKPEHMYIEVP